MRYRAVLFDLFGTLVPPFPRMHQGELAAALGAPSLEAFGRAWSATRPRREVGSLDLDGALHEVCSSLGLAPGPERLAAAVELRLNLFRGAMRPRPDALDTVRAIRSLGARVGLVSNCSSEGPRVWRETPFAPLFDAVVFSSEAGQAKPDPRAYGIALERVGARPEEAVFVANGESSELAGALAVGIEAILLDVDGEPDSDEAATWRGARIARLSELLSLLR